MSKRERRAKARKLRHGRPRHTVRTVTTTGGAVAAAAITMGAACAGASAADFNGAMLKDLNTTGRGSDPQEFITAGGKTFFVADDPAFGPELWTSNGTQAGTALVKDIYPGRIGSFEGYGYGSSSDFAAVGSTLYFAADDGTNGTELWKSDGTAAGTQLVKNIRTGSNSYGGRSSNPTNLTAVGSTLFFTADDGTNGEELWKSDGTSGGTQLVKNINSHNYYEDDYGSSPSRLTAAGSTLYFSADDGDNGRELWKSDGSFGGTGMVKDINPGSYGSFTNYIYGSSSDMTAVGSTLYFAATDGTNGIELWKSDGTPGNTQMIKDIRPGGIAYGGDPSRPSELTAVGSTLFFTANDGTNGTELWKSDGTEPTTQMVKDIQTGSGYYGPNSSSPSELTAVGSTLFFTADDDSTGRELWKSGGTAGTTQLVKDIRTGGSYGGYGSRPSDLTAVGSTLYFSADDDSTGRELWKSDGTAGGTQIVKDIRPGSRDSLSYNYGSDAGFAVLGGNFFFGANDGVNGDEPWVSDGTAAGTRLAKDVDTRNTGSNPEDLTDLGGTLFFEAEGDDGSFWKSDGTSAGTVTVDDILAAHGASYPRGMTNVNGTLYFSAYSSSSGRELWKSDGTAGGTQLVKDIRAGYYNSSSPREFTAVGGTIFFSADSGSGDELWKTDGTSAGTQLVKEIRPGGSSSYPSGLTAVGSTLYFSADDGTNGTELWKSGGTGASTVMVKDIRTGSGYYGPNSSGPSFLTAVGSTLYFSASNDTSGRELWKSDGTAAGTQLVKDIQTGSGSYGPNSSSPFAITAVGTTLYFSADDGSTGAELWKSDGTAGGTTLVKDIRPGSNGSMYGYYGYGIYGPTAIDGTLYFAADAGSTGAELWKSDGTAGGTTLVKDLLPGSEGSYPGNFTKSGDRLFFSASDGAHGTEIWKADLEGTVVVPPPPPPPPDTEEPDNRFKLPKKGKVNLKKGTVTVKIKLPGPGKIAAKQTPPKKKKNKKKRKKTPTLVRPAKKTVKKAGFVKVVLKPAKAGLKKLKKGGKKKLRKFKASMSFTYTPTGGKPNTQKRSYTFKRKSKSSKRR